MSLADRLQAMPALLEECLARYRVPGASLAVLHEDEIFETAAGVVNRKTQVRTTPDAVFQIGSITKVFTTTLIMQLVDGKQVELDEPIVSYMPEFQLGDHEVRQSVTLRHLLTHTSGIDGDLFQDTGRGEDCIERFVLACAALGQLHPPGKLFSYCNAGFNLAGRIIEKRRRMTWDDALKKYLLDPIGAESMHTLPEYTLYYRAAVGHVPNFETGEFDVAAAPYLTRSNGPAGATPFAAARDLLAFARMHLNNGQGRNGARVLSEESTAAMQTQQVVVPEAGLARAWGLGWMLFDWGGKTVIGHGGSTIGQNAYFRILPGERLAVALLSNGGNTEALYRRMFNAVFGELAGIEIPALPDEQNIELDPARYEGIYERLAARLIVKAENGKLFLTTIERRPLLPGGRDATAELHPVSKNVFYWLVPGTSFRNYVNFLNFGQDGRAAYLHAGGRSARRVG